MDGLQLFQGYRGAARRQFTFYYPVSRSSWYSFNLGHEATQQIWIRDPGLAIQRLNH